MRRRHRHLIGFATATLVVAGAVGATASSSIASGTAEEETLTAVTEAVQGSEVLADIPADDYTLTDLQQSGSWASVTLTPTDPDQLDPAVVVLEQSGDAWVVSDLGTAAVGCGIAPEPTLEALGLTCP